MKQSPRKSGIILVAFLLGQAALHPGPSRAGDMETPWNRQERLPAVKSDQFSRVRFVTGTDFAPFNSLDASGKLTGFNVDLVAAICKVAKIEDRCQIQALPWDEVMTAIEAGQADAIVAGLAQTEAARGKYLFTRSYLRLPARLVTRSDRPITEPFWRNLAGKRIGVMGGSVHEVALRSYFPDSHPVVYSRESWGLGDLKTGTIDGFFGDGMGLSLWLGNDEGKDCCAFSGGAYPAPELLGDGLAIAVGKENKPLADLLNQSLRSLQFSGAMRELYLRHFPVSFY